MRVCAISLFPRPSHHHRFPARPSRRTTLCGCRVRSHETSTPDRESVAPPCANLRVSDRLIAGFCSLWIKPTRLLRTAIVLKPSTVLQFHRALVRRKYRLFSSPKRTAEPGPKGPSPDVIRAVVGYEAAQCDVGLSTNGRADHFGALKRFSLSADIWPARPGESRPVRLRDQCGPLPAELTGNRLRTIISVTIHPIKN
jgi:hypothetical protein